MIREMSITILGFLMLLLMFGLLFFVSNVDVDIGNWKAADLISNDRDRNIRKLFSIFLDKIMENFCKIPVLKRIWSNQLCWRNN